MRTYLFLKTLSTSIRELQTSAEILEQKCATFSATRSAFPARAEFLVVQQLIVQYIIQAATQRELYRRIVRGNFLTLENAVRSLCRGLRAAKLACSDGIFKIGMFADRHGQI